MIVIGIILVLLGLVLGGFVVAGSLPGDTGTDVSFSLFGLTVETSVVVVFALGALTLLLLELGVIALRSGARKSSKRRAELQRLRRVEAEVQSRQAAEAQRNAAPSTAAPSAAPAPFARRDVDPSTRPVTPSDSSSDRPASDRLGQDETYPTAPASTRPPEATGTAPAGPVPSDATTSGSTAAGSTSPSSSGFSSTDGPSSTERTDRP